MTTLNPVTAKRLQDSILMRTGLPHLRPRGKNVFVGDATEYDFWQRCILSSGQVDLVFLAMSHRANCIAAQYLRQYAYPGVIASIVRHDDEHDELKAHGVHYVFNIYDEAGSGFARHVCSIAAEDGHSSACLIKR